MQKNPKIQDINSGKVIDFDTLFDELISRMDDFVYSNMYTQYGSIPMNQYFRYNFAQFIEVVLALIYSCWKGSQNWAQLIISLPNLTNLIVFGKFNF